MIKVFAKNLLRIKKPRRTQKDCQNALCKKGSTTSAPMRWQAYSLLSFYTVCAMEAETLAATMARSHMRRDAAAATAGAAIVLRWRRWRTSTTLDFTLGALTCSRSAPWPHLKLEQTAEVWPNSQSGEQELNVNCRAGAMRRGCGVWVAQANRTKEHPDWTRPVSSLQYML